MIFIAFLQALLAVDLLLQRNLLLFTMNGCFIDMLY